MEEEDVRKKMDGQTDGQTEEEEGELQYFYHSE